MTTQDPRDLTTAFVHKDGRLAARLTRTHGSIRVVCELVDDPPDAPAVSRDLKDDYLVALANAAHADALVSGDQDLLVLSPPQEEVGNPVMRPRRLGVLLEDMAIRLRRLLRHPYPGVCDGDLLKHDSVAGRVLQCEPERREGIVKSPFPQQGQAFAVYAVASAVPHLLAWARA